jgi:hypothetical protein
MTHILMLAGVAILMSSTAMADDHLFQAQQHGLANNEHSQGVAHGDKAPGQGSPFAGHDQCTPATATEAAQDHANVKPKGAASADACEG